MASFNEIINSDIPVLVDFYADWCGPCKVQAPILQALSGSLEGKARILKVNVDKNPQAASAYGIQGIPTLIVFKNGKQLWRQSGVVQAAELKRVLGL